jgi:PAS domain-containing protein
MRQLAPSRKIAWRTFVIVMLMIFLIETMIMILLHTFLLGNVWLEVFADPTLLILFLFPSIYFFILRPMEREIAARQQSEKALQEANDQAELRVTQRAAELESANSHLEAEIGERKQSEDLLRESERRFRSLFENAPISLWEEDFSLIVATIDELRQSGVTDFRAYFGSHPEAVANCARMVRIIDVNKGTLKLYQAKSKDDFLEGIDKIFSEESLPAFREELIALAEGKTRFESEAINQTLIGNTIYISLSSVVAPNPAKASHRRFVSITDITNRKQAEMALQQTNDKLNTSVAELERRNQEASVLTEMSDLLQACTSIEEAYRTIRHIGPRLFPASAGALYLYNPSREDLEAVITWGNLPEEQSTRIFEPDRCWALRRWRLHIIDSLCDGLACHNHSSALVGLCIPLIAQGESLGVFYLRKKEADMPQPFNEQLAITPANRSPWRLPISVCAKHYAASPSSIR